MIVIKAKLPEELINNLIECENVVFDKCYSKEDIPIIQLNQSEIATKIFLKYLQMDETLYEKYGPILMAQFGHPTNPYVNSSIQVEVLNLLNTYKLDNHEFIPIPLSYPGNFQYNSNKSIYSAYLDIQKTTRNQCPLLQNLQSGTTICDISIIYSNIIVTVRIYTI